VSIEEGNIVDPIALTVGHAIGVVLVINAVAKATQKDHVQEDGGDNSGNRWDHVCVKG
tara:strand:+ start:635 stop:808 length:174 start_codon:yes stop_codon:yes gene_type:complete